MMIAKRPNQKTEHFRHALCLPICGKHDEHRLLLTQRFGAAPRVMPHRSSTPEIEANARAFELVARAESVARQALANGFRLCAACSMRLAGMELCAHHTAKEHVDGWATGNRIWCEFVHGKWPARQGAPTAPSGQDPRAGDGE